MSTATEHERPVTGTPPAAGESRVVRLSVNLAPNVASALKATAALKGVSITEAIRHAIALWKLVSDEQAKGRKLMVVEGEGEKAVYREIFLV